MHPRRVLPVLALSALAPLALAAPVLLQATDAGPWGYSYNRNAFGALFGAEGFDYGLYGSVAPASIFRPANRFVYLEGSQSQTSGFLTFYGANRSRIEDWVTGGGSLVVAFSPQSAASFVPGFGIGASPFFVNTLNAVGVSPVSDGPFGKVTTLTGAYGATVEFTGEGSTTLFSGSGGRFMVERDFGLGHVVFSSLTTSFYGNFTGAQNERFDAVGRNLIAYGQAQAVPEPVAALPLLLTAFAVRRRRPVRARRA